MQEMRSQVLKLYRALLRQCEQFADANVRAYTQRRVRAGFRENQHLQDSERIASILEEAQKDLEMIKRQSAISRMYPPPPYVVESASGLRSMKPPNPSR